MASTNEDGSTGGWRRHATRRRVVAGTTVVALAAVVGAAFVTPGVLPGGASSTGSQASPAPDASPAASEPTSAADLLHPVRVSRAIRYRDGWGVRAITLDDDSPPPTPDKPPLLQEFWTPMPWLAAVPVTEPAPAETLPGPLQLQSGSRSVLALGITSPDRRVPLDARVWKISGGDVPQRVVPAVMEAEPGRTLWLPTSPDGRPLMAWEPGLYRIDLVVGRRIVRVTIKVPGTAESGAGAQSEPTPDPRLATTTDDEILAGLQEGLTDQTFTGFVVTGGNVIPVPRASDRARDEVTSWLDPVLPGLGRGFAERARYGHTVIGTSASAIGWMLPAGAEEGQTDVYMLSPREEQLRVQTSELRVQRGDSFIDAVLVRPIEGARWPAAVYRLEASWQEHGGGIVHASWHVDLTPAVVEIPGGSQADLARVWREKEAGGTAAAVFDPGIYDTVPLLSQGDAESGQSMSKPGDACADRRLISPSGGPLGIRGLDGKDISVFQVYRVFDGGTRVPMSSGIVPDAAPDLALVMTPVQGWQSGAYRIALRFAAADPLKAEPAKTFLVCVGTVQGDGLVFDPATTSKAPPSAAPSDDSG